MVSESFSLCPMTIEPDYVVLLSLGYNPTKIKHSVVYGVIRKLPYGNGCHKYRDCFTCPYPISECKWQYGTDKLL